MAMDLSKGKDKKNDREREVVNMKIPMDGSNLEPANTKSIYELTGIKDKGKKRKYKHSTVQKVQSGHIPLMKINEITSDEIVVDRIHWELIGDKGHMYVFRRRSDEDIEKIRRSGEFYE